MMRRIVTGLAAAVLLLTGIGVASAATPAPKTSFKIAWSIYVGWMPWPYADETGILKKWADKYGIKIELVQFNDYVESINQYTAGAFDGVVVTNMDTLTIPAAGGVDSTAVIVGDYSNGNDAVILKKPDNGKTLTMADIAKQKVYLVQLSVSQYLLSRALDAAHLKERDVALINTSDADIVAAFATPDARAVVTWNPQVGEILKNPKAQKVFDSANIPGEILDLMVLSTTTLKANPKLAMALTGAWYEVMSQLAKGDAQAKAAREAMAKDSGTDLAGYDSQLKTTKLFGDPAEAAAFADNPALVKTMDLVRHFSFDHGLLGEGAKSVDAVGIAFPTGTVLGDKNNVKFRYDDTYMKLAADHKL